MRRDDANGASSTLDRFSHSNERRGLVDATERMARHGAVNTNQSPQWYRRAGSRVSSASVAAVTLICALIVFASSSSVSSPSSMTTTSAAQGGGRLGAGARDDGSPRVYVYDIVNAYPHDKRAFTQGLTVCGRDVLCESTGAVHGMRSQVRVTDVSTGERKSGVKDIPSPIFAEGLTKVGDELFLIAWRSNKGLKYALSTNHELEEKGTFRTPLADGWGLAAHALRDGTTVLYATDASNKLHVLDVPIGEGDVASLRRSVTITDNGEPVRFANELEVIDDAVFANILERPCLARIDPETGKITGWVNMASLKATSPNDNIGEVMNGIAYDVDGDRLFVTGKMWATLFEVKLREVTGAEYEQALIEARSTCTPPKSLANYGYP